MRSDVGKITAGMDVEIQIGPARDEDRRRVSRIYPKAKKDGNATLFDIEISIGSAEGIVLRAGFSATGQHPHPRPPRRPRPAGAAACLRKRERFVDVGEGPEGPVARSRSGPAFPTAETSRSCRGQGRRPDRRAPAPRNQVTS